MEQKRILQIAFIFFACGLSIELLKALGKSSPINLKRATIATGLEEYDVQLGTEDLEIEVPTVSSNQNIRSGVEKIKGVKVAEKKKVPQAKDANKNEKKKEEEKKTAKKKKKKKKKKIDSFEPDDDTLAKKPQNKTNDFSGSFSGYYNVTNTVVNPGDQNKDLPKTIQEWENLLLKDPSHEETNNFIKLYRSGEVSSEIYYTIAQKMLGDPRPQMRQQGLILLESVPGQASYELLAETFYNEPNNSAFRATIEKHLGYYTRSESLAILLKGLSREKSLAINATSVTLLGRSIDKFKADQARIAANTASNTSTSSNGGSIATSGAVPTTPSTSPTSTSSSPIKLTRAQTLYSKFQNPLRILIAEGDSTLAPAAAQVLSQLLALIN